MPRPLRLGRNARFTSLSNQEYATSTALRFSMRFSFWQEIPAYMRVPSNFRMSMYPLEYGHPFPKKFRLPLSKQGLSPTKVGLGVRSQSYSKVVCLQHCSYLSELFNHKPQSSGFGLMSRSAYVFLDNIASVSRLRLVNQGLQVSPQATASNARGVKRGIIDMIKHLPVLPPRHGTTKHSRTRSTTCKSQVHLSSTKIV